MLLFADSEHLNGFEQISEFAVNVFFFQIFQVEGDIDKACAAGVVTKITDRVSSRFTYNGIRRVRQLGLGCESN